MRPEPSRGSVPSVPANRFASPFREEYGLLGGIPLGQEGRRESALLLSASEAPSPVFTGCSGGWIPPIVLAMVADEICYD